MNITLDASLFIQVLLQGNLCDTIAIPRTLGLALSQVPEISTVLHVDNEIDGKSYSLLYSAFGWTQELAHREYLQNLGTSNPTSCYNMPSIVPSKPIPQISKKQLQAELQEAIMLEDFAEIARLKKLMKNMV